jgi:hypothetical protein
MAGWNDGQRLFQTINDNKGPVEIIKRAEMLHEQISMLKASDNFLSLHDLMGLRGEIKAEETLLSKSNTLYFKIENLESQASSIRTSDDSITLPALQQLKVKLIIANGRLERATKINAKISEIERNPTFLQFSDIGQLKDELDNVKLVFQSISSQGSLVEKGLHVDDILKVQDEARGELECVVCLEVPSKGMQVFSCLEHHLLCSDCAKQILGACPICRQNFKKVPLARNRLAKKMIKRLN